MKILITGASGFIGRSLVSNLSNSGLEVAVVVRRVSKHIPHEVEQFEMGDFDESTDFINCLKGVNCIIHLAGMAHKLKGDGGKCKAIDNFRKVNVGFTVGIANQAIRAGVKRFIFLSSIGVNGNKSSAPISENDNPNPQDAYSISKYEAEQQLLKLGTESDLEVTIIRPPLVYGKDAPGNFGRIIKWATSPILLPLPLGAINNSRSFIAIDNLISFIAICVKHKEAANQIFVVSDDEVLSTTQVLRRSARAYNRRAILIPIPSYWLLWCAKIFGKEIDAIRLLSTLVIDNSKAKNMLDWLPRVNLQQQLTRSNGDEENI